MDKENVVLRWSTCAPYLLSALRIVAAFLLVQFGTAKLFAFPAAILPGGGTASLASLPGVAGSSRPSEARCSSSDSSRDRSRSCSRARWHSRTSSATRRGASGRS
jgi:hypothetical protein